MKCLLGWEQRPNSIRKKRRGCLFLKETAINVAIVGSVVLKSGILKELEQYNNKQNLSHRFTPQNKAFSMVFSANACFG